MAGVTVLWGFVMWATERKVGCVLNRAQRGGVSWHRTIVYTRKRNSEQLGAAWFSWTFSKNSWEALRIIYSSFPPRLRFLADTISDWHFPRLDFLSHCSLSVELRLVCFHFFSGLTGSGRNWKSPAEAEHRLGFRGGWEGPTRTVLGFRVVQPWILRNAYWWQELIAVDFNLKF